MFQLIQVFLLTPLMEKREPRTLRKYLNNKRKHRKKLAKKSITKRDEEIKSTYIRNLSNCNFTTDQITYYLKACVSSHLYILTLIVLKNKFSAISANLRDECVSDMSTTVEER